VLAGMIAARLATGVAARESAAGAVYAHGLTADNWPADPTADASALATLS
jgi:NAD(P)H-hydrate repair Nnr-like enzyme with NAD(P)H-hydrate dehydratase domain